MMFIKKNQFPLEAVMLSLILFSGCLSEDSTLTEPALPEASVEQSSPDLWPNPLDNLRLDPTTLKMLAELRQATDKYHDIEVAEEDGYVPATPCVSSSSGGMGYHFVKGFPFNDGIIDPTKPEALLYEMDNEGEMHLVAVEFIVDKVAWDLENEEPPFFGSREFDFAEAPTPLPFDNYQLHAWVWKGNPKGIFTKFNPNVKCN